MSHKKPVLDPPAQGPSRRDLLAAGGVSALLVACGKPQDLCSIANCDPSDMGIPTCAVDSFAVIDADRMNVGDVRVLTDEQTILHRAADGFAVMFLRCTHAGCFVSYNQAEKSYDCPCHGSRYELDGSVKRGPATEPLRYRAACRQNGILTISRTNFARGSERVK